jgi:LysM repeat protein
MKLNKLTLPMCLGVLCAIFLLTACERSASTPPVPTSVNAGVITAEPTLRPLTGTVASQNVVAGSKSVEGTAAPAEEKSATPTPAKTADKNSPYMGQHVVRGGETLYSIGRAYGVDPMAIATNNHLEEPYTIYPGQKLDIPRVRWPGGVPPGPVAKTQFDPNF